MFPWQVPNNFVAYFINTMDNNLPISFLSPSTKEAGTETVKQMQVVSNIRRHENFVSCVDPPMGKSWQSFGIHFRMELKHALLGSPGFRFSLFLFESFRSFYIFLFSFLCLPFSAAGN